MGLKSPFRTTPPVLFLCFLSISLFEQGECTRGRKFEISKPQHKNRNRCPFIVPSVNEGYAIPDSRIVVNMTTSTGFGRTGNMVKCTFIAIDYGIRCGAYVEVPKIAADVPFGREKMAFDFGSLKKRKDWSFLNCQKKHGNCRTFWRHGRPHPRSQSELTRDADLQKIWSGCFMSYLNTDERNCPPDMEDKLVIHVRNGDVFTDYESNQHLAHGYGQQPLCTVLGAVFDRRWSQILVISEIQEFDNPKSGPIIQVLHTLEKMSKLPIEFVKGTFKDHLTLRMCAVNLVVPHTTLNYLNPFLSRLKRLYDPELELCPLYPYGYGWLPPSSSPPIIYTMKKKPINWEDNWTNSVSNLLKLVTTECEPYYECVYPNASEVYPHDLASFSSPPSPPQRHPREDRLPHGFLKALKSFKIS